MKNWKPILTVTLLLAGAVLWMGVAPIGYEPGRAGAGGDFEIVVTDADVDSAWEIVDQAGTTGSKEFVQMATDTNISVYYNDPRTGFAPPVPSGGIVTADSQIVFVAGIRDSDSTYVRERLQVAPNVTKSTTTVFRYFEKAWADTDGVGYTVAFAKGASASVRQPQGALLDSIPANLLDGPIAHLLFGPPKDEPTLAHVSATLLSNTDTAWVQLRGYPDIRDCRNLTKGYTVLWDDILTAGNPNKEADIEAQLTQSSYIAGFSRIPSTTAASATVNITIRGTRTKKR